MNRRICCLIPPLLLAGSALAASPTPGLAPGNWSIKVVSTTNGKPEPDQATEECLQAKELKDLGKYFSPKLEGVKADCKRTRQPSAKGQVDYQMKCTGKTFTMDAETSVTVVDSDHFTARMKLDTKTTDEAALVVANVQARRTGPCQKGAAK